MSNELNTYGLLQLEGLTVDHRLLMAFCWSKEFVKICSHCISSYRGAVFFAMPTGRERETERDTERECVYRIWVGLEVSAFKMKELRDTRDTLITHTYVRVQGVNEGWWEHTHTHTHTHTPTPTSLSLFLSLPHTHTPAHTHIYRCHSKSYTQTLAEATW